MNCIFCEVIRARLFANAYESLGLLYCDIAERLSDKFGENYFVKIETSPDKVTHSVYRYNKLPPHNHYLILQKVHKRANRTAESRFGEGTSDNEELHS